MKKNINNSLKFATLILTSSLFIFTSCSNKNNQQTTTSGISNELEIENTKQWENSPEKICVVYGYGYNSAEFINSEKERFEKKYGLSDGTEESGLIIPLVFPDDFKGVTDYLDYCGWQYGDGRRNYAGYPRRLYRVL